MSAIVIIAYLVAFAFALLVTACGHCYDPSFAAASPFLATAHDLPIEVFVTTTTTVDDYLFPNWPASPSSTIAELHQHPEELVDLLNEEEAPLPAPPAPPLARTPNATLLRAQEALATFIVDYQLFAGPLDAMLNTALTTDPHTVTDEERDAILEQTIQLDYITRTLQWRFETANHDINTIAEWLKSRRDHGWTNNGNHGWGTG